MMYCAECGSPLKEYGIGEATIQCCKGKGYWARFRPEIDMFTKTHIIGNIKYFLYINAKEWDRKKAVRPKPIKELK